MQIKEILLEYNRELTLNKFRDKMFNRYTNGPDRELAIQQLIRLKDVKNYTDEQIKDTLTRNLLASFENNDPTSNMKYVPWIIQKYINGEIERLEDLNQVSSDLEIYDT